MLDAARTLVVTGGARSLSMAAVAIARDVVDWMVAHPDDAAVRPAPGAGRPVPDWAGDGVERAVRGLLR